MTGVEYACVAHSTGHSAFSNIKGNGYKNADFTYSTGHNASFDTNMTDANECKDADFVKGTGHNASFDTNMTDANECKDADFVKGTDPMDDLVASMKKLKISTDFEVNIPPAWPIKQNMDVAMDTQ